MEAKKISRVYNPELSLLLTDSLGEDANIHFIDLVVASWTYKSRYIICTIFYNGCCDVGDL